MSRLEQGGQAGEPAGDRDPLKRLHRKVNEAINLHKLPPETTALLMPLGEQVVTFLKDVKIGSPRLLAVDDYATLLETEGDLDHNARDLEDNKVDRTIPNIAYLITIAGDISAIKETIRTRRQQIPGYKEANTFIKNLGNKMHSSINRTLQTQEDDELKTENIAMSATATLLRDIVKETFDNLEDPETQ